MANHFQSVVTMEKPLQHLGLTDWHSRVQQLRNVADTRRDEAFNVRQTSRILRNETRIQSTWDTYYNNSRLSDRIHEVDRWRETIQTFYDRIVKEIEDLREEKLVTERELEALITPLNVVSECLTMRDCRLGSELTYDDGDTELKKELAVVENNQRMLRDQCQAAWEKLNRLDEVKFKLNLDLTDKREAEDIDMAQLQLDKHCSNITFKTDPTRVPRNSSTHPGWLEYTKYLKALAEKELEDAYAMRESLFVSREKARNILTAQQERTEHTLRKRIFETQRARNELEWQQLKMREEMERVLAEILTMEKAWRDKIDALKLVETRLENRAQRSGMELCCDDPYSGLCDEVARLKETIQMLTDKINQAKSTYSALEDHAAKIDRDLQNKQHSLMTDIRGIDLRQRLRGGEFSEGPMTQTDRNLQLSKMVDEIPKN